MVPVTMMQECQTSEVIMRRRTRDDYAELGQWVMQSMGLLSLKAIEAGFVEPCIHIDQQLVDLKVLDTYEVEAFIKSCERNASP